MGKNCGIEKERYALHPGFAGSRRLATQRPRALNGSRRVYERAARKRPPRTSLNPRRALESVAALKKTAPSCFPALGQWMKYGVLPAFPWCQAEKEGKGCGSASGPVAVGVFLPLLLFLLAFFLFFC